MLKWHGEVMPPDQPGKEGVGNFNGQVDGGTENGGQRRTDERGGDAGWSEKGSVRDENGPDETFDFGKHMGKTFREVYLKDPSYCGWTVRQDKPGAMTFEVFQVYFVRRMNDLTQKNDGIRGKASEVEKQLRDRVLEACCEEQMVKLSRQEERAMEEERAKKKMVQQADQEDGTDGESKEGKGARTTWADVDLPRLGR